MEITINNILSLCSEIWLWYLFCQLLIPLREQHAAARGGIFLLMLILLFLANSLADEMTVRLPVCIIIDLLITRMTFCSSWKRRISTVLLFYVFVFVVEACVISAMRIHYPASDLFNTLTPTPQHNFTAVFIRLLEYVLLSFFTIRRKLSDSWHCGTLIVFPAVSIGVLWYVCPRLWEMNNQAVDQLLILLAGFLLLNNFCVFSFFQYSWRQAVRYKSLWDTNASQREYFETLAYAQKSTRKLAHDMRHHCIFLLSALDRGEVRKARQYVLSLDESLDSVVPVPITGNPDIDALLIYKARDAEMLGIRIETLGALPKEINIEPADISMVLGNALDNAFAAASQVMGERIVTVTFGMHKKRFSFRVVNPYTGRLRKKPAGGLRSSKADGGLGLEIMEQVARKYNGELLYSHDDQRFTLMALLFAQEKHMTSGNQ